MRASLKLVILVSAVATAGLALLYPLNNEAHASTNSEFETGAIETIPGNWTTGIARVKAQQVNSDYNTNYNDYSSVIIGRPSEGYYFIIGKGINSQNRNPIIFGRQYIDAQNTNVGALLISGYNNSSVCMYLLNSDNTLGVCNNGAGNIVFPALDDFNYIVYDLKNELYAPAGGMTESWFLDWNSSPITNNINYTGVINVSVTGAVATFNINQISPTPTSYSINYGDGTTGNSLTHDYMTHPLDDKGYATNHVDAGQKTVTFTFNGSNEPLYVYPTIAPYPEPFTVTALTSGDSVAVTTDLKTQNGINKILYDFNYDGNTFNGIDYALNTDPAVTYYANDGYEITCGLVNNEQVCSNQINYHYANHTTHTIAINIIDSAGYERFTTVSADSNNGETKTTQSTDSTAGLPPNGSGEVVCGSLDLMCQIGQLFRVMFIPDGNKIAESFTNFNNDNFGIGTVIAIPITTLSSLIGATCSPIALTIPFINQPMSLPCYTPVYQANFGSFWTIYQVILTGSVAYLVMINTMALVKRIKDPDDDKIEVFHL